MATFAPAAAFGTLMAAEARRRGAGHIRQMVILGDGAAWIWNLAGQHFPEATQVVDLFHAREHLHDLAKLLEFMLGDGKDDWLAARLAELDDGNIEAICAAARAFPLAGKKASDLQTALGYFEHNAPGCVRPLQEARNVRRIRRRGSGMQSHRRAAPQTVRHAMDPPRRHGILTLRCLDATQRHKDRTQPRQARGWRSLTRHLNPHHSDSPGQPSSRRVTYILSHTQ